MDIQFAKYKELIEQQLEELTILCHSIGQQILAQF